MTTLSKAAVGIKKVSSKKKSTIAPVTNSPVMIKMDNSKPIRKSNAWKVSDNTNDPLGTSETTLPYTLSQQKSTSRVSKRAKKTTVSYCDHSESESESEDEEVIIDEEDEEVTKPSTGTKPSAATRTSVSQDKEKRATTKRIKVEVL